MKIEIIKSPREIIDNYIDIYRPKLEPEFPGYTSHGIQIKRKIEKLIAIQDKNPTYEQINEIMGNNYLTSLCCNECDTVVNIAINLYSDGEEPGDLYCKSCVEKMLTLFKAYE